MFKTPRFDQALNEYFSKLELDENGGQWRTCRFSGEKFYVRPEDIEFYKKIRVPLPTLSAHERIRRKLAFVNSYNLFHGTSALTEKSIISAYPPGSLFKIYEHQAWFGEGWDPFAYGVSYDTTRPFWEQYRAFQLSVPRPNLTVDPTNVNSDYTNSSSRLKNCYLVFDSYGAEDCAYGIVFMNTQNCLEGLTLYNAQECYGGFESSELHRCFFVEYSKNCLDSYFLYDCRNCQNCFGCVNLRHKKYYFFNKPLTKEQYLAELKRIDLGNRDVLREMAERFAEMKKSAIYKETHNERSINSFGDYLKNCKNCYASFYVRGGENIAYALGGTEVKDALDLVGGVGSELCYDTYGGVQNFRILFSVGCDMCRSVEYCDGCINCHDCFACIGLKNKSFCIFNVQYSEDEYWKKLDEIKTAMFDKGEYGEFFPPHLSPFPYNLTYATSYVGYDDVAVASKYGYQVNDVSEGEQQVDGELIVAHDLPPDVKDVSDEILKKIIFDTKNSKKFRYTRQELEFHHRFNIALPTEHYSLRLLNMRKKLGSIVLKLHDRTCPKCGKIMQSSYAPDRPEIVYCEQCYQAEVV